MNINNQIKDTMKKQKKLVYPLLIMVAFLFFASSCEKENDNNNGANSTDSFTDSRDGNIYKTVKIGKQIWMAENLKYLPNVIGPGTGSETEPYYYVYDYNGSSVTAAIETENYKTYGVLYNWSAATTACPKGWHLPSDAEWKVLEMHLGMTQQEADNTAWRGTDEGNKLKEAGTSHWEAPSEGTNSTGFTALPGGDRVGTGVFFDIGHIGFWWSATGSDAESAWIRSITYYLGSVDRHDYNKRQGFSVRCIKDN